MATFAAMVCVPRSKAATWPCCPCRTQKIRLAFLGAEIDGAWVSEPLVSELVSSANARVLLDEAREWPDGRYPATLLCVRTRFMQAHPTLVARFVGANADEIRWIDQHSEQALALSRNAIGRVLGKRLPEAVARGAWSRVEFGTELTPRALERSAADARTAGFLPPGSLSGLWLEGMDTDGVANERAR